jgi:choline dehydrogenase-like flavoprotein
MKEKSQTFTTDHMETTFDYLVVGSGPSGCAFARSLFEQILQRTGSHLDCCGREIRIAVLEEAPENPAPVLCETAAGAPGCIADDRCYVPCRHVERAFENCLWSGRGRALGGGSAVNGEKHFYFLD